MGQAGSGLGGDWGVGAVRSCGPAISAGGGVHRARGRILQRSTRTQRPIRSLRARAWPPYRCWRCWALGRGPFRHANGPCFAVAAMAILALTSWRSAPAAAAAAPPAGFVSLGAIATWPGLMAEPRAAPVWRLPWPRCCACPDNVSPFIIFTAACSPRHRPAGDTALGARTCPACHHGRPLCACGNRALPAGIDPRLPARDAVRPLDTLRAVLGRAGGPDFLSGRSPLRQPSRGCQDSRHPGLAAGGLRRRASPPPSRWRS